jgi:hypothetical protein
VELFDPRGHANRALLVGVSAYTYTKPQPDGVPGHLPAVEHNVVRLRDVLRRGGVFAEEEITLARSPSQERFGHALRTAVREAEGLLLFYFAGHGAIPAAGNELFLQLRNARVVAGEHAVFPGADAFSSVLTELATSRARHVVVVLDCCFAGNAARVWETLPDKRRISLLMSVQANHRIDAGPDDSPTPFTERLVHLLGRGDPMAFQDLWEPLHHHMRAHHRTLREEPWDPQSRTAAERDVLLVAPGPGPSVPITPVPDRGTATGTGVLTPALRAPAPEPFGRRLRTALRRSGQVTLALTGLGRGLRDLDGGADRARGTGSGKGPRRPPGHGTGDSRPRYGSRAPSRREGARDGDGGPGPGRSGPRVRRLATVFSLALAVLATSYGGYALLGPGGDTPCGPPLELRVLTDPDLEQPVAAAAGAYLTSAANTASDGCRRTGITVYSAGAADVVTALRQRTGDWRDPRDEDSDPQRDVGAQPDVWLPASRADVARVTAERDTESQAALRTLGTVAHSPLVLAVPDRLAAPADERSGRPLAALLAALAERDPDAEVRRPDPEFTDTALFATIGLHGRTEAGVAAGEQRVAQPGPPSPTAADLLCALPQNGAADRRTGALVPEFLLRSGVGCARTTRVDRSAEYPSDVPAVEPAFVHVHWEDADRDEPRRTEAVEDFYDWLRDPSGGQRVLGAAGFRTAADGHALLDADRVAHGVLRAPGPLPNGASPAALESALAAYRGAHGPGRVLFLLDSSGSMGGQWHGPSGGPGILKQSLGGLGDRDEYGVWGVASEPGAKKPYRTLLAFGQHRRREAEETLDREAVVRDAESDPDAALRAALKEMAGRGTDDDRPELIVYITDDEDGNRLTGARFGGLLDRARTTGVPVAMVSLTNGGCARVRPDARIAEASGGRCLDADGDLGAGLKDEVARVGTGEDG